MSSKGAPKRNDWQAKFLETFKESGTVSEACRVSKVSRTTAYTERQRNEVFALAWADIEEATTEEMEREAIRRGAKGFNRPVFQGGKQVGTITEYSDTLLQFMLRGRRPEKYRDHHTIEHSGQVTKNVKVDLAKLSDEQLASLEAIADALED